jgi:hypothetical protein
MNILQQKTWSPYLCGILIGLLQIPTYFLIRSSLGMSRAYSTTACLIQALPSSASHCFDNIKDLWSLYVVLGLILGAWLSKTLSKTSYPSISPIWKDILALHYSPFKRYFMAFGGGCLFILGAKLGTGCTSGNGVSGIALLQVGSLIVISMMFLSGIVTVYVLTKFLKRKGKHP